MTPALYILAALATSGSVPSTAWPPEVVAERWATAEARREFHPPLAEYLALAKFGLDEQSLRCIDTPGRVARQTCQGFATQLPALSARGLTISLPTPLRAYVVREGAVPLSVVIDPTSAPGATDAWMWQLMGQLNQAPLCSSPTGDLVLRQGEGPSLGVYVAPIAMPFSGVLYTTLTLAKEALGRPFAWDTYASQAATGCVLF